MVPEVVGRTIIVAEETLMRPFALTTVAALLSGQTPPAQPTTHQRSICIAPFVADPTGRKGAGMPRCDGDHYSLNLGIPLEERIVPVHQ
jgi:hypothetical protein